MKGDFTRDTFDPARQFSRVLMQQGRVQLDADWNEQQNITSHYLRMLNVDLMGEHWGPVGAFDIKPDTNAKGFYFGIGIGNYYVHGILCSNAVELLPYTAQAGFPFPGSDAVPADGKVYLAYLDVWERHITYLDDASLREVALGGPDTTTRVQTVWQVKLLAFEPPPAEPDCEVLIKTLSTRAQEPHMRARAKIKPSFSDACTIAPESSYRGPENQLYRVEVHSPGTAGNGATFKWSRDNGAVVFPVVDVSVSNTELVVQLAHLGRDDKSTLSVNDRVELLDDDHALRGLAEPLARVKEIDKMARTVTLELADSASISAKNGPHRTLRRWDHAGDSSADGAELIVESDDPGAGDWIDLEDGVAVQFATGGVYRTGDYWLLPARVATGDVEWPYAETKGGRLSLSLPPRGPRHHYAPLAVLSVAGGLVTVSDPQCRREVQQLWNPPKSK